MEQVTNVSQRIIDFCKDSGIDKRRAYYAGLCMEEMAGNVVHHGFSDGKNHSIDIRVAHNEDDVIPRIRDNCREFNPTDRAKANEGGTEGKNIGIRMVYKIAKEVSYQKLLGLNVLTMRI